MRGGGVHAVELVFLSLLAFVVLFAAIARKLNLPYPIVLLLAGLLLSFLPRVPKVTLNPDVIFLIVLPPLFIRRRGLRLGVTSASTSSASSCWPSDW